KAAKGRKQRKATGSAIRKVMPKPRRKPHSENGTAKDPFLTLASGPCVARQTRPPGQVPGKPRSDFTCRVDNSGQPRWDWTTTCRILRRIVRRRPPGGR